MRGLKNFERKNRGYIFLSHSHRDIDKVRRIRNRLEQEGFEPLCFYLKCLNDDSEIEELIKREIDAREWFIFVDSENSRRSRWVQLEREYINRTNKKKIVTLDMENPKSFDLTINKILHNLRVCVVSSGVDSLLAERLENKLKEKDYLVFGRTSYRGENNFWKKTKKEVAQAAKEGCVIALLSKTSMLSVYTEWQVRAVSGRGGNIIPVLIDGAELDEKYSRWLSNLPKYHLSSDAGDGEIEALLDQIGDRITKL